MRLLILFILLLPTITFAQFSPSTFTTGDTVNFTSQGDEEEIYFWDGTGPTANQYKCTTGVLTTFQLFPPSTFACNTMANFSAGTPTIDISDLSAGTYYWIEDDVQTEACDDTDYTDCKDNILVGSENTNWYQGTFDVTAATIGSKITIDLTTHWDSDFHCHAFYFAGDSFYDYLRGQALAGGDYTIVNSTTVDINNVPGGTAQTGQILLFNDVDDDNNCGDELNYGDSAATEVSNNPTWFYGDFTSASDGTFTYWSLGLPEPEEPVPALYIPAVVFDYQLATTVCQTVGTTTTCNYQYKISTTTQPFTVETYLQLMLIFALAFFATSYIIRELT